MATNDEATVIAEALAIIDKALKEMTQSEVVSSVRVGDMLLDMRSLLTAKAT